MDNKELDSILEKKFKALQAPPPGSSIVPQVMSKVRGTAELQARELSDRKSYDWLLLVALVLGALVALPQLQAIDLSWFAQLLPRQEVSQVIQLSSNGLLLATAAMLALPACWLLIEE